MTLGFGTGPELLGHKDRVSNYRMGTYELFYLNEVLLKPKDELIEKYGKDVPTLQYISDKDARINDEDLQGLKIVADSIMLVIKNGQLTTKLE
ncbi:unnamed protein product [Ambrosiozyma monospora]|uniref:Unnamed protein product n=1 Tax=Ambrosiozyma monospora TaxID=43982 RepID=A0ACB5SZU8_AMBMO|nr:unnamed protein product [Ambrosiozyma monospora]